MGSRIRGEARYLFECFCEVAPRDYRNEPYIIKKYPDAYTDEETLRVLPKFTYPCVLDNSVVQHFSFVLTSFDSMYTFCFCRHDPKSSTALVLVSHLPWHDIFYKLLNILALLMNDSRCVELNSFLEAAHMRPPMPGHTLKVSYNAGQSVFTCRCPDSILPSIPGNCNLAEYLSAVDPKCMVGLWAALLNERRVAVVATKPGRLSAVVQVANATLYPMAWQHIFIPVLPKHLSDYLLAPMPLLVGVPRSVMATIKPSDLGDLVILDIDEKTLKTPFNDIESLPFELVSNLNKMLNDSNELLGDAVPRAFLRALVQLIGGYRDAIRIEKRKKITFDKEAFIKTRKPSMQPFLKKMLELQIFQQFIEERLELLNSGRGFNDVFELECGEYTEKGGSGRAQQLLQQYKDWAKTMKRESGAFFKNVKDKANPAVKSAVKSVKQGGRGVRSAMRGLKTRMRDGTRSAPNVPYSPRPSSVNATFDDSRLSYTPTSSSSSASLQTDSPSTSPYNTLQKLPLTLLDEMKLQFKANLVGKSASTTAVPDGQFFVDQTSSSFLDKTGPRPPPRPSVPVRYPIVPTRTLVDITDAPPPPPRTVIPLHSTFVAYITKDVARNKFEPAAIRPAPITFTVTPNDHTKLTASASSQGAAHRKLLQTRTLPMQLSGLTMNGRAYKEARAVIPKNDLIERRVTVRQPVKCLVPSPAEEGNSSDLIELDVPDRSASAMEKFDPLTVRSTTSASASPQNAGDSDLLQQYGLDFSRFGLGPANESSTSSSYDSTMNSFFSNTDPQPAANNKGNWTTFN